MAVSKTLYFLVALCLVKSNSYAEEIFRKLHTQTDAGNLLDGSNEIEHFLQQWNSSYELNSKELDFPADEYPNKGVENVADEVFEASLSNSAMILTDLSKCVTDYSMFTCMKLLLLSRINGLLLVMNGTNTNGEDLSLLNGMVTFKWLNNNVEDVMLSPSGGTALDNQLTQRVLDLFQSRSLRLSLLPGFGLEITPKPKADDDGFVCFSAKTFVAPNFNQSAAVAEMRKKMDNNGKKKKKGGFNFMPMMIVPQMIMLGMLPFALANLKMMVMNAFMINSMALNSAIFMTIRNLVFGPKKEPNVKYVNYGYGQKKKTKRPEIVLHSPSAFVKRPSTFKINEEDTYHPPAEAEQGGPYIRRKLNKRRKGEVNIKIYTNEQQNLKSGLRQPPTQSVLPVYHQTQSSENQPYYPSGYEQTAVDAPISYLNNNQYLLPEQNNPQISGNAEVNQQQYDDAYQAYNNIHLLSQSGDFSGYDSTAEGSKLSSKFSSKYNEESEFSNNQNTYSNHRIS